MKNVPEVTTSRLCEEWYSAEASLSNERVQDEERYQNEEKPMQAVTQP